MQIVTQHGTLSGFAKIRYTYLAIYWFFSIILVTIQSISQTIPRELFKRQ